MNKPFLILIILFIGSLNFCTFNKICAQRNSVNIQTGKIIIASCQFSFPSSFAQRQSIGGFNVYFGELHNHSNTSDAMGTPNEAYKYALKFGGFDKIIKNCVNIGHHSHLASTDTDFKYFIA